MSRETPRLVNIKQLLGLALAIGYLVAIELWLGWVNILKPVLSLPTTLLLQMLGLLLLTYLTRAMRLYSYFRPATQGRFSHTLAVMLTHNVLNHLLPARVGEVSLPVLLRQQFAVDLMRGSAALVWLRVLDLHCLLVLALCAGILSSGFMPSLEFMNQHSIGAGIAVSLAGFAALPIVAFLLLRSDRWQPLVQSKRVNSLSERLLAGIPSSYREFFVSWFWTWITWLVKLLTLAWLLSELLDLSLGAAAVGVTGGELTAILPVHAPGGFGTYAAGVVAALLPFSVDSAAAFAAAAITHIFLFSAALLSGWLGWLALPKNTDK